MDRAGVMLILCVCPAMLPYGIMTHRRLQGFPKNWFFPRKPSSIRSLAPLSEFDPSSIRRLLQPFAFIQFHCSFPMKKRIYWWSLTSALAGFLFGFDTVVISGAEQTIQSLWDLSAGMHGFAMASALYGTVLGSLLGSWPTDRFGRKATLLPSASLLISAVGCGFAWNVSILHRRALHRRPGHRRLHRGGAALHLGNRSAGLPRTPGRHVSVQHRFRHHRRLPLQLRCSRTSATMPGAGCWGSRRFPP